MKQPLTLLQQAAALRDEAMRALRLSKGLAPADKARLEQFSIELREKATALEQAATAEGWPRSAEPERDAANHERKPGNKRGNSSDPEPQT